jgi:NADH dehydrogenase [ubiquinone] 1 alpha subcomplex assembly factor 7
MLARAVLDARPRCSPALRYVLVERSAAQREAASARLPLELPLMALGPALRPEPGEAPAHLPGTGPVVTALADLPAGPIPAGVVLANELLDNLPFDLLERVEGGWAEVRVGVGEGDDGGLAEVLLPAPPEAAARADRLAPRAAIGARIPIQDAAADWLRRALGLCERGRVVAVDYASTTPELAGRPWLDWVRTYRAHGRGGHPLEAPGAQDVTCEVAVDQLARLRRPASGRSQADFLRAHGLDQLAAEARAAWQARAHIGDLAALAARSRAGEAIALTDEAGLGAFRVLEWVVG